MVIDKGLQHLTVVLYFQNVIFRMFHKSLNMAKMSGYSVFITIAICHVLDFGDKSSQREGPSCDL